MKNNNFAIVFRILNTKKQANCEQKKPVQKSHSGQAFTYTAQATQG